MARHWQIAVEDLTQGSIDDWLRQTLGDQEEWTPAVLAVLNAEEMGADEQLLRFRAAGAGSIAGMETIKLGDRELDCNSVDGKRE